MGTFYLFDPNKTHITLALWPQQEGSWFESGWNLLVWSLHGLTFFSGYSHWLSHTKNMYVRLLWDSKLTTDGKCD